MSSIASDANQRVEGQHVSESAQTSLVNAPDERITPRSSELTQTALQERSPQTAHKPVMARPIDFSRATTVKSRAALLLAETEAANASTERANIIRTNAPISCAIGEATQVLLRRFESDTLESFGGAGGVKKMSRNTVSIINGIDKAITDATKHFDEQRQKLLKTAKKLDATTTKSIDSINHTEREFYTNIFKALKSHCSISIGGLPNIEVPKLKANATADEIKDAIRDLEKKISDSLVNFGKLNATSFEKLCFLKELLMTLSNMVSYSFSKDLQALFVEASNTIFQEGGFDAATSATKSFLNSSMFKTYSPKAVNSYLTDKLVSAFSQKSPTPSADDINNFKTKVEKHLEGKLGKDTSTYGLRGRHNFRELQPSYPQQDDRSKIQKSSITGIPCFGLDKNEAFTQLATNTTAEHPLFTVGGKDLPFQSAIKDSVPEYLMDIFNGKDTEFAGFCSECGIDNLIEKLKSDIEQPGKAAIDGEGNTDKERLKLLSLLGSDILTFHKDDATGKVSVSSRPTFIAEALAMDVAVDCSCSGNTGVFMAIDTGVLGKEKMKEAATGFFEFVNGINMQNVSDSPRLEEKSPVLAENMTAYAAYMNAGQWHSPIEVCLAIYSSMLAFIDPTPNVDKQLEDTQKLTQYLVANPSAFFLSTESLKSAS